MTFLSGPLCKGVDLIFENMIGLVECMYHVLRNSKNLRESGWIYQKVENLQFSYYQVKKERKSKNGGL
jgi:hypothetical protein